MTFTGEPLSGFRRWMFGCVVGSAVALGLFPLVQLRTALGSEHGLDQAIAGALALGAAMFTALHVYRLVRGFRRPDRPAPTWLALGLGVAATALLGGGLAVTEAGWLWLLYPGAAAADIATGRRRSVAAVALVLLIAAAVVVVLVESATRRDLSVGGAIALTAITGAVVWVVAAAEGTVLRLWHWARAMDRERQEAADVARTRERLRISEDLHDLIGRALDVIVRKSDLAVRLHERDSARAMREVVEIQRVAAESMTELRRIVRSSRPTELGAELTAARILLGSAGVRLQTSGTAEEFPARDSELLGRVLRESVTNLLRHSDATWCSAEVVRGDDELRMTVSNDGVSECVDTATAGAGTGIASLSRAVEEHRGALRVHDRPGDRTFVLEVVLPTGPR